MAYVLLAQQVASGISAYLSSGTDGPEGFQSANPGSWCRCRDRGDDWKKVTGTGNTGWQLQQADAQIALLLTQLGSAAYEDTSAFDPAGSAATAESNAMNAMARKDQNLVDLDDINAAIQNLNLGTAAMEDSSAFATAAQGALADTAVQPGDLAAVAFDGSYASLADTPSSLPPTGSAGGDLSGSSYPDPVVTPNAITNTKLADMPEARLKGRSAGAGTGDPQDIDATAVKTMLVITTSDVSGLGTAALQNSSSFDAAGAAAAAQAASQPLDADLTAIAGLTTTSFGRSLLTQADAAATRTTIGAGTSNFNGAFSSLTGTPTTLSGYGITDATSNARSAISLTTTGTSGAATYSSVTGVFNIPNYAIPATPVYNTSVSRSLSNTAGSTNRYTMSATRPARLFYAVTITYSITVLLGPSGTIYLEYSLDNGSTWLESNRARFFLNLGIALSGENDMNVCGDVPINALVRLRPATTNATLSYTSGSEMLY